MTEIMKPYKLFRISTPPDTEKPFVIFDVPHASKHVPLEMQHLIGNAIPKELLDSHDGYDPCVMSVVRSLRRQYMRDPNACFFISEISRLIADHNRIPELSVWEKIPEEWREHCIENYARPYTNTFFELLENTILDGNYPIVCNVHTYNDFLNGKERPLYSVAGDPDTIIVQTMHSNLRYLLDHPENAAALAELGVSRKMLLDKINGVYNLGRFEPDGSENPLFHKNMAMRYSIKYRYPWVHVETRNDMAHEPIAWMILTKAYQMLLSDPAVIQEWKCCRDKYFNQQTPSPYQGRPFNCE